MSNERLRQALQEANLQPDEFADLVGADPKSVRRWLSGQTTPTARSRAQAVQILSARVDIAEHDLWPETTAPPAGDDSRDLVAIYTRADDIRAPDWRALLQAAHTHIDLLGMTLTDILTAAGTTDLLIDKARNGAYVRILTAHPESIALTLLADQLGQAGRDDEGRTRLDRDRELSRSYLDRVREQPEIQCLAHWAGPGPTILRFDDDMLVSMRLSGDQRASRPLMHLRRRQPDGLFDQHLACAEGMAAKAEPIAGAGLSRGETT